MRTPPYDIHQRRPATAVSMPLFIFLLFSSPLALCRCQPSRNPLSLWIPSPSPSYTAYIHLVGCCPISPIPVVAGTSRRRTAARLTPRRLPANVLYGPLFVDSGGKCLRHLRLRRSSVAFIDELFLPLHPSSMEITGSRRRRPVYSVGVDAAFFDVFCLPRG